MRIPLRLVGISKISASRGYSQHVVPPTRTDEAWIKARPYEDIPGPKPLPIVGNVWRFMPGIGDLYAENFVHQQKHVLAKYGELVRISHVLGRPHDLVFVFNPEDIETVFRNDGMWPSRPHLESLSHYRTVTRGEFFKGLAGLSTDQGEAWYRTRTIMNPVMMKSQNVNLYTKRINDIAEEFVEKIPGWRSNDKSEMPENFKNELHKWALESIGVVALDTRLGCLEPNLAPDSEAQRIINGVHDMLHGIHVLDMGPRLWKKFPTPAWKKFVSTMDFLSEASMKHINKVIESSKENKTDDEDSSVLQKILARDPEPIRAVIMALDMLAAGVDTTSSSLINALLCLSMNLEKQNKLHEELCTFLPRPDDTITSEMLNEMKFLKAVIKESMRFRPIVSLNARTSQKEMILSNHRVPAGVDLLLINGLISKMEKYFPEAEKFIPERWLRNEQNPFPEHKINPFVFLPFGYGARKCVGMRFASLELEVLLAKLIRRFHWEWHYPEVRYKSSLIQIPVDPLRFTVKLRQK